MKWLFFILLLANIALFVWIYPQNSEPPEVVSTPGVKSLILLSEIDPGTAKVEEPAESVVDPLPANEKLGTDPSEPKWVEDVPVDSDSIQEQINEEKEEQPSMVTGPQPDQTIEKLVLGEKEEQESFSDEFLSAQDILAESIPEPAPELQCMRIGPLGKRVEADKLSLNLSALGLQPELHSEISNDQEGYWVLVPPQKNRAAAKKIVKRLQEAGVTDYWRFTSGKLRHAISLGLFRNARRAEIRKQSIEEKGFEVEVRPRYRQKTLYWLGYVFTGESPVTVTKWAEMVESYPNLERDVVDCQEIATH